MYEGFYPTVFDSDYCCFVPPKDLTRANFQDFVEWFDTYNSIEVVRFVYVSWLNDMVYLMHYQGSEFEVKDIDGYLAEFGNDPKFNDLTYAKNKMLGYLKDWFEIAATVRFIQESLDEVILEDDADY